MRLFDDLTRGLARAPLAVSILLGAMACTSNGESSGPPDLTELGSRYAAAWSSQDPERLAAFYADNGSLRVNDGDPAVGRAAIAARARAFMDVFPDMVVTMDSVVRDGDRVTFHWTWTGTNAGPGGTGRSVRINGYKEGDLEVVRVGDERNVTRRFGRV